VGGVIAQKINEKSGRIATARVVRGHEEVMVISAMGTVLRTPVSSVSVQGRAAQGVAFMNLRTGDRIACVALLNGHDQDDDGGSSDTPDAPRRGRRGARGASSEGDSAPARSTRGGTQTPAGPAGGTSGQSAPRGRQPRQPRA